MERAPSGRHSIHVLTTATKPSPPPPPPVSNRRSRTRQSETVPRSSRTRRSSMLAGSNPLSEPSGGEAGDRDVEAALLVRPGAELPRVVVAAVVSFEVVCGDLGHANTISGVRSSRSISARGTTYGGGCWPQRHRSREVGLEVVRCRRPSRRPDRGDDRRRNRNDNVRMLNPHSTTSLAAGLLVDIDTCTLDRDDDFSAVRQRLAGFGQTDVVIQRRGTTPAERPRRRRRFPGEECVAVRLLRPWRWQVLGSRDRRSVRSSTSTVGTSMSVVPDRRCAPGSGCGAADELDDDHAVVEPRPVLDVPGHADVGHPGPRARRCRRRERLRLSSRLAQLADAGCRCGTATSSAGGSRCPGARRREPAAAVSCSARRRRAAARWPAAPALRDVGDQVDDLVERIPERRPVLEVERLSQRSPIRSRAPHAPSEIASSQPSRWWTPGSIRNGSVDASTRWS